MQILQSKLAPPVLDPARHLERTRLLDEVQSALPGRRVVTVTARAGQGKSIFAAQFLERQRGNRCWYQIDAEDADPVFLLKGLAASLAQGIQGFSAPKLAEFIRRGEFAPSACDKAAAHFSESLSRCMRGGVTLVIDDIYRMEGSEDSLSLLASIISFAPRGVRFVLLTRHPEPCSPAHGLPDEAVLALGNDSLAMTPGEIAELYGVLLDISATRSRIRDIHTATEGWTMGVLMAAAASEFHTGDRMLDGMFRGRGFADATGYFQAELLASLSELSGRELLRLALVEEMPEELAAHLAGEEGLRLLEEMRLRNMFLRKTGDGTYLFHHIFRQCLEHLARERLEPEACEDTLSRAGRWFFAHGRMDSALRCYLDGGNYRAVSDVLREAGLDYLAENRQASLAAVLDRVPESVLLSDPCLLYFFGTVRLVREPFQAMDHVYTAYGRVKGQSDLLELLIVARLIQMHFSVDGQYRRIGPLLERAEELFADIGGAMPETIRAQALLFMGAGHLYYSLDTARAAARIDEARTIAGKLGRLNFEVECLFWKAVSHLLEGSLPELRDLYDEIQPLAANPELDPVASVFLLLVYLNCLSMEGDLLAYRAFLKQAFDGEFGEFIRDSTFRGFISIWDTDAALMENDWAAAGGFIRQGMELLSPAQTGMWAQMHNLRGIALAAEGDIPAMEAACREGERLARENRSPVFINFARIMISVAYILAGKPEEALRRLDASVELDVRLGRNYMIAQGRINRAWALQVLSREEEAAEDLESALGLMEVMNIHHLYGLYRPALESLLPLAVKRGMCPGFTKQLSRARLRADFNSDGVTIPLLELRTLGRMEISCAGEVLKLPKHGVEILLALCMAPDGELQVSGLLGMIWPDSPSAKARRSLDTTLSRTRGAIDRLNAVRAAGLGGREYLRTKSGKVSLLHFTTDAETFERTARKGLHLVEIKKIWQAEVALRSAMELWTGGFAPGVSSLYGVYNKRESLKRTALNVAAALARLYESQGRRSEALQAAGAGADIDPADREVTVVLYGALVRAGDLPAAGAVLKQYRNALSMLDVRSERLEAAVASVRAGAVGVGRS